MRSYIIFYSLLLVVNQKWKVVAAKKAIPIYDCGLEIPGSAATKTLKKSV